MEYLAKGGAFSEMFGNKTTESSADVSRYASITGRVKPGDSAAMVLPLHLYFFLSMLESVVSARGTKRKNRRPAIIWSNPLQKHIPASMNRRITDISTEQSAFAKASPLHDAVLKESGYD